jgi:hypothetical protein
VANFPLSAEFRDLGWRPVADPRQRFSAYRSAVRERGRDVHDPPGALLSAFQPRASLVAENLVLRRQLATLRRTTRRPRLRPIDRPFWVLLSRVWSRWVDVLVIVRPETVIAWYRRGFGGSGH